MQQLVAVKRFLQHYSGICHHTIMLFDRQIALKVYSGKFWLVTCTFFDTIFMHKQVPIIVESYRKMVLLFDGQTGNLCYIL